MKHTPGPWELRTLEDDSPTIVVCDAKEEEICCVHYGYLRYENESNARLIATAPDLLEAAKLAMVQVFLANGSENTAYKALEAAINKAEGRSE